LRRNDDGNNFLLSKQLSSEKHFMKFLKKILWILVILFIAAQFIRPKKNISEAAPAAHISQKFSVPDNVKQILSTSCYDCHSNNTRYPWYNNIQPVAWWMGGHVEDGKKHLNFDEYSSYNLRRQYHKFEEMIEMVKKDEMPLPSYLVLHGNAKLSMEQKVKITDWCSVSMEAMKSAYPIDSLLKK
jgi:hypothetical protein